MERTRRWALLFFAGALTLAPHAALAGMEDSDVSLNYTQDGEDFAGRVTSDEKECSANRVVKIYKRTDSGKSLQGKDRTNDKGRFKVHVMEADGRYFAVAKKYEGMNDLVCDKARSETINV